MSHENIAFRQSGGEQQEEHLEPPISLAEKKMEKLIDSMKKTYNPDRYDDASEDPNVQEIVSQFTSLIQESDPTEIKTRIIPMLTTALEKRDFLRRKYLGLRRKALAALQSEEAIKIVMDYYNQGKALDKATQGEKRSQIMAIGWTDLEALDHHYWPKALEEAQWLRPSEEKEQTIASLKALRKLTRDTFNEVQKQEEQEAEEERVQFEDQEKTEEASKVIPFKRNKKQA